MELGVQHQDNMIWEGRRERNQEEGGANQLQVEVSRQVREGNGRTERGTYWTLTQKLNNRLDTK